MSPHQIVMIKEDIACNKSFPSLKITLLELKVAYTSIIKGIGGTEMTQNELYMTLVIFNEVK